MTKSCDDDFVDDSTKYHFYVASRYAVEFMIFVLFIHTIRNEIKMRDDKHFKKARSMRVLYILQQALLFVWLGQELLRTAIDPHTGILEDSIWCKIASYSAFYPSGIFYGFYLAQVGGDVLYYLRLFSLLYVY